MKKNRKGFGLIELTLALAIAAVVGFVVIRAYSEAQNAKLTNDIINNIKTVHSAVKTVYGSQNGYNGLTIEGLKSSMPKSMADSIGSSEPVLHMEGGSIMLVTSSDMSDPSRIHSSVIYTIYQINDSICAKLASSDMGRESYGLNVNGQTTGLPLLGGGPSRFEPQRARQICNQESANIGELGAGNQVSIYFK